MTKRLIYRGRNVMLPLVGDVVAELCFRVFGLPTMVFHDDSHGDSEMQFEEVIVLERGGVEVQLTGSCPGPGFDPKQLQPLLDLLGARVTNAWALHDGTLEITFSSRWVLRVVPESGYEAWHFQYPRPGRLPAGDVRHHIGLHGTAGSLV